MLALFAKLPLSLRSSVRSRTRLQAETLVLRRQVLNLRRKNRSRVRLAETLIGWCWSGCTTLPFDFERDHPGQAGDHDPMAPTRIPSLLAREVSAARRSPRD
jgi:hypothetical protein